MPTRLVAPTLAATTTDSPSGAGAGDGSSGSLPLGKRIVLATSLVILLAVGTAARGTWLVVRNVAHKTALDSLQASAAAQETLQAQYYEQLKLISRLIA